MNGVERQIDGGKLAARQPEKVHQVSPATPSTPVVKEPMDGRPDPLTHMPSDIHIHSGTSPF